MSTSRSPDNMLLDGRRDLVARQATDGAPAAPAVADAAEGIQKLLAPARVTAADLLRFGSDDVVDWPIIGFWIAVAGGLYPVLVAIFVVLQQIVGRVLSAISPTGAGPSLGSALETAATLLVLGVMLIIGSAFFYVAAFLTAGMVALFVLPVAALVVRTLELRVHPCWIGAGTGGLVGYAATALFVGIGPQSVWSWLVGPALATLLGQLGGFYGGWVSSGRERWLILLRAGMKAPIPQAQGPQKFQFGVRHLLWLTLWCSAGLTFLKLLGLLTLEAFVMLCAWGTYSLATLLAVTLGLRWWMTRRLEAYDASRWRSVPIEQGQSAPRD